MKILIVLAAKLEMITKFTTLLLLNFKNRKVFVQELLEDNSDRRQHFCEKMMKLADKNAIFVEKNCLHPICIYIQGGDLNWNNFP